MPYTFQRKKFLSEQSTPFRVIQRKKKQEQEQKRIDLIILSILALVVMSLIINW